MSLKNKKTRAPGYLHHKPTGQARVRIDGKDHYLGTHGSVESYERYAELIRKWKAQDPTIAEIPLTVATARFTVQDLVNQYLAYIIESGRYLKGGKPTTYRGNIRTALDELTAGFGKTLVQRFGESALVRHRDELEAREEKPAEQLPDGTWTARRPRLTRVGINRKVQMIRQCFTWGRRRELVPKAVWLDLQALQPLQRHETGGRPNPERRKPATEEQILAILPHVGRQVAAMLRVQWLTGMRPGVVCAMRWADIDEEPIQGCWVYSSLFRRSSLRA
jgi:integrase